MPDRKPTPPGATVGSAPRASWCPQGRGNGSASRATAPEQASAHGVAWRKRRVLLLNTTFEPLTALPLRRAIVLVVCGKAEIVHGDSAGLTLRSATSSVEVPSVIRLSTFVQVPYRGRVPLSRSALMQRDSHRCVYCGMRAETIDHVVPRSRGGAHSWENCVACCVKCNRRKADRTLRELGWRLAETPRAPRGRNWRLITGVHEADPLWLPYLGEAVA
ncbi:HNH endonuclease [Halopolyspora algeriensis]|uniref:HNH endonuclease n=1 Tax=Halopolyspora algeriensis TaxID=1500506 RepID=UPI0015CFFA01